MRIARLLDVRFRKCKKCSKANALSDPEVALSWDNPYLERSDLERDIDSA